MFVSTRRRQSGEGQILVLFAGGLIAIILGVGLVIDVGYAWAQQRHTQNSADASARAGALVLAKRSADGPSSTVTDSTVNSAVFEAAVANGVTVSAAEYTDWQGNALGASVGGGTIPANAAGVRAATLKQQGTYLIRVAGINTWDIVQEATAVSGPTAGCFDTQDGCSLLPVAFPVTVFTCTNNGKTQPANPPQTWAVGQPITLPLCGGNPGSVGWIDWTPPAGGTSELTNVILNPPNVSISLPSWQYITETGDISAAQVEDALNTYAGEVVLVPFFDSTCNETPTNNETSGCPTAAVGGAGVNQWYHITRFLSFQLDAPKGAFVNGNNSATCAVANAAECLKGRFVSFVTEGQVGAPCPGGCPAGTSYAVQLYR